MERAAEVELARRAAAEAETERQPEAEADVARHALLQEEAVHCATLDPKCDWGSASRPRPMGSPLQICRLT
jgi:hypothetical protein